MAVTISRLADIPPTGLVADRRLYITADDEPVEEGDARAAFLLASGPGDVIPVRKVQQYGLRLEDGRIAWGAPQAAEPPQSGPPAPEPEPTQAGGSEAPAEDQDGGDEAAGLVALAGGWYAWRNEDGTLLTDDDGNEIKVRGRQNALARFLGEPATEPEN